MESAPVAPVCSTVSSMSESTSSSASRPGTSTRWVAAMRVAPNTTEAFTSCHANPSPAGMGSSTPW